MVRRTILLCDFEDTGCNQEATTFRIWRDGERQAWSLDLCEDHASPLLELLKRGVRSELPSKGRVRMEVTSLRPTDKTRPLKK